MTNRVLIILGVTSLILIGVFVLNNKNGTGKSGLPKPYPTLSQEKKSFESKTDNQGEVTVEVTPKNVSTRSETTFQVTLNTHSVALDLDLVKISKLIDDQGNTYQPLSWDGGSGGHHLSGT